MEENTINSNDFGKLIGWMKSTNVCVNDINYMIESGFLSALAKGHKRGKLTPERLRQVEELLDIYDIFGEARNYNVPCISGLFKIGERFSLDMKRSKGVKFYSFGGRFNQEFRSDESIVLKKEGEISISLRIMTKPATDGYVIKNLANLSSISAMELHHIHDFLAMYGEGQGVNEEVKNGDSFVAYIYSVHGLRSLELTWQGGWHVEAYLVSDLLLRNMGTRIISYASGS